MAELRLGLWNMDWLNDLFTSENGPVRFKPDGTKVRVRAPATRCASAGSLSPAR